MGKVKKKVRVFALGNALLGDAGVGLALGYQLSHSLSKYPVDIYIEEESNFSFVEDIDITEPIIIIKGLLTNEVVGSVKSFNLNANISDEFGELYNIDEIPTSLQNVIDKRFGEIIIIGIKSVDWTTQFSDELLEKFDDLNKDLVEKIKDYSLSYIQTE